MRAVKLPSSAQHHRPVSTVGATTCALDAGHGNFTEARIHDVGAVPRAVHPTTHDALNRRLTSSDVLAVGSPVVARRCESIARVAAIAARMAEKIALLHVIAVSQRSRTHGGVPTQ